MTSLDVRYRDRRVGTVRADAQGRFSFRYDPEWLSESAAFPLSLTIPLEPSEFSSAAHAFFANLLPEGLVRQAVCRRLGISETNDFALLRAIGGECAGALAIVDPDETATEHDSAYEELADARLQELVAEDAVPLLVGGARTRLSLAGAQEKLPVAVLADKIHLPLYGAPSTHILKLPNPRFPHLPENEAFTMGLAAAMGFRVATTRLVESTTPASLLVERYDRRPSQADWPVERLHQEDLCQASGLLPGQKYEQEGGPTFVGVIAVVRAAASQPLVDVRRLFEWQAFNVVVGNADGHGKNLALLYDDGISLAPFYDLVCTRHYDRIDRLLAMGVGGRRDPDQIGRAQWSAAARDIAVTERVVLDVVEALVARCLTTIDTWTAEFRDRYGHRPILESLPRRIRRGAERCARALQRPSSPKAR